MQCDTLIVIKDSKTNCAIKGILLEINLILNSTSIYQNISLIELKWKKLSTIKVTFCKNQN